MFSSWNSINLEIANAGSSSFDFSALCFYLMFKTFSKMTLEHFFPISQSLSAFSPTRLPTAHQQLSLWIKVLQVLKIFPLWQIHRASLWVQHSYCWWSLVGILVKKSSSYLSPIWMLFWPLCRPRGRKCINKHNGYEAQSIWENSSVGGTKGGRSGSLAF